MPPRLLGLVQRRAGTDRGGYGAGRCNPDRGRGFPAPAGTEFVLGPRDLAPYPIRGHGGLELSSATRSGLATLRRWDDGTESTGYRCTSYTSGRAVGPTAPTLLSTTQSPSTPRSCVRAGRLTVGPPVTTNNPFIGCLPTPCRAPLGAPSNGSGKSPQGMAKQEPVHYVLCRFWLLQAVPMIMEM